MKTAYLVIAHGSREKSANKDFFVYLEHFRKAYPKRLVEGAFLEIANPSIPEGIENCIAGGAEEIIVIPLMFFAGRHVKQDIPNLIQTAKTKYPKTDFHFAGALTEHPLMIKVLEAKAQAVKKNKSRRK